MAPPGVLNSRTRSTPPDRTTIAFSAGGAWAATCLRADRSLILSQASDNLPLRVVPVRKPGAELAAAIARAYAQQEGSAASVVSSTNSSWA